MRRSAERFGEEIVYFALQSAFGLVEKKRYDDGEG